MRPAITTGLNVELPATDERAFLALHPSGPTLKLAPDFQRMWLPASVTGHSQRGSTFHATVAAGRGDMETRELLLDDLLVNWAEIAATQIPDPTRVTRVWLGLDPRASAKFFRASNPDADLHVNGRSVWPVDHAVLDELDAASGDLTGGTTVRAFTFSSRFSSERNAPRTIASSDLEQVCLELEFDAPTSLSDARNALFAAQTLLEAVGETGIDASRELWVWSTVDGRPGEVVASEWWSRALLGQAGDTSALAPWMRVGTRGKLDIHSIGGLRGILEWMTLCHNVPYIASALSGEHRTAMTDRRNRISSLAIGWEHLSHWVQYDGRARSASTANTITELVSPLLRGSTRFRSLVNLSWNTNNEIKHVALRASTKERTPLRRDDVHGHKNLADFMYTTLVVASMEAAGMRTAAKSLSLDLEDEGPHEHVWGSLADEYAA